MTRSVWQKNDKRSLGEVDTIIVGGGITGVSLAYHAKKSNPTSRVIVLEADELASKASGRNAGFLLMGTAENYAADVRERGRTQAKYLWDLSKSNLEQLGQVCDRNACQMLFEGSVVAEPEEKESEELELSLQLMNEDGFEASLLTSADLERDYSLRGMKNGLLIPQNGSVDPIKLVRHLAKISGCEIHTQCKVEEIGPKGSQIQVSGQGFDASCETVFVASNSYLPQLISSSLALVRPVRAQMLSFKSKRSVALPVYTHSGYFYFRQLGDKVILGGARHLHRDEEVGYDDITTNHVQIDLENYAREHIVGAEDSYALERWSGTMGFTKDHLPKVGRINGLANGYWIGGFSGHGLGFAFALAELAIQYSEGESMGDNFNGAFLM